VTSSSANWKQGERSNPLALRILVWCARTLERRTTNLLLWFIASYFAIAHGAARRASRDFLRRVGTAGTGLGTTVRHFRAFARMSVDRVLLLSGRTQQIALSTTFGARAREVLLDDRGCLLVVAHFGSFEALRVPAARSEARTIRILLDRAVGSMAMSLLESLDPQLAANTIDAARPGPDVMLDVRQALQQGHIVGIMADRARHDERVVDVDFLGGRARLPAGPWLIAALLDVPVVTAFAALQADDSYVCHYELFDAALRLPREQRDSGLRAIAQRYASLLETQVRATPLNWFNFYDFWLHDDPTAHATRN